MSQNPGDKKYVRGVELSVDNTSSTDLEYGHWATVNGDHEVAPADSNGAGGLDAIVDYPIPAGDSGKAHFGGGVYGRVADDVNAGDHLQAPDTSGTGEAGVAESGGDDSDPVVLGEPIHHDDGYWYALVQF